MDWLLSFTIMVMGMIGGQAEKGVRRYGIPGLVMLLRTVEAFKNSEKGKDKLKFLIFGVLIPILSIGYGINSALKKVFKKDWIVRIVYGMILSVPLGAYIYMTGQGGFKYIICLVSLPAAWSIHAGSLGKIGKYDILVEDIIRYFTLGRLITWIT